MKTRLTTNKILAIWILLLFSTPIFGQICQIPNLKPGISVPANFDFVSVQNGNWTSGSTWQGGIAPPVENINKKKIKITHDVTVQNGNLKLDNNTVIYIDGANTFAGGGRLTVRNGNIHLEDGNQSSQEMLIVHNGWLRVSGNVQQSGSNTVFWAVGSNLEIGDEDARSTPGVFTEGLFNLSSSYTSANFQNTNGYRRLEDVCLNVTQDLQNAGGTDEFIRVCGEIGDAGPFSGPKNNTGGNSSFDGDDNGNFQVQSNTGTSTKIYNSEFYVPNGSLQNSRSMVICGSDFRLTNGNIQNQSNSTIVGNDIVLWINNGGNGVIQNAGTWAASTISAWRVDHSSNPSGLSGLVAESSAADILTHFNDCFCGGGGNCPEDFDECFAENCDYRIDLVNIAGIADPSTGSFIAYSPSFEITNKGFQNITSVTFTTTGTTAQNATYDDTDFDPATPVPINFTVTPALNLLTYNTPVPDWDQALTLAFFYEVNASSVAIVNPDGSISLQPGSTVRVTITNDDNQTFWHDFVIAIDDPNADPTTLPLCQIIPLPVELTNFTGRAVTEGIALNWRTASEKNNDRFEVERSSDGRNFEKIGTVKGNGSSNVAHSYNFLDKSARVGVNYYRLNQVDFSGENARSKVIRISAEKGTSLGVQLIPNPCANENCTVQLKGIDTSQLLTVEMHDLTGRLIFSQQVASDQTSFTMPKISTGSGVYILKATNGTYTAHQKIIIQE